MSKQKAESKLPPDLRRAITAKPSVEAVWRDLTPIARRDFTRWVTSAKQPETRQRRVERTRDMLASGKRRPCCYAVVPINLYKALTKNPKAKAGWGKLTPDERRDFVSWVEVAKDADSRNHRIEKACGLLVSGKHKV